LQENNKGIISDEDLSSEASHEGTGGNETSIVFTECGNTNCLRAETSRNSSDTRDLKQHAIEEHHSTNSVPPGERKREDTRRNTTTTHSAARSNILVLRSDKNLAL
jgi:hypothetical protein